MDRQIIHDKLERARATVPELVADASGEEMCSLSDRPSLTNEQLLFHMAFGYMMVRALLSLVRMFGHLPDGASRWFARILELSMWSTTSGPALALRSSVGRD